MLFILTGSYSFCRYYRLITYSGASGLGDATVMSTQEFNIEDYMKRISAVPVLSREEEYRLAKRYTDKGDEAAFERLIQANLRFVAKIAYGFRGYGFPLEDLVQEGNVGLMVALRKFDPSRKTRLISYAVFWIRAQINSYVMKSWSVVKLGTTQTERKMFFKVRSTRSRLEFEQRIRPEELTAKLAEEFKTDEETVAEFEGRFSARDDSLSGTAFFANGEQVAKQYATEDLSPEEEVCSLELRRAFRDAVQAESSRWGEREQFILGARLLAQEPQPLREIAARFDISAERVRQLEARIVSGLRKRLEVARFVPQVAA